MKTGSKRGAALAYVIMITAVLMILAAALVFTAKFNIDYSRNSLESRQAYLDAKSAIEYGKAYLINKPDSGDFSILYSSDTAGFKIGAAHTPNAIAFYDSSKKVINAAGKYKSSDRVRRLGYQLGVSQSDGLNSFLAVGTQYGSKDGLKYLFDDNHYYRGQGSLEFPIIAKYAVIFQGMQTMAAPEINFIGRKAEMGANYCLFSNDWNNSTTLQADFIGFDGDIVGKAFAQPGQLVRPKLIIKSNLGGDVIVRFTCDVNIEFVSPDGKVMTNIRGAESVKFAKGYYSFPSGTDLFDLATVWSNGHKIIDSNMIKKVEEQFKITQLCNDDVKKLISSEEIGWTGNGVMGSSNPQQEISEENATVFLCASSFICLTQPPYKYAAPNIVFQWNNSEDLAVSYNAMSASVTLKAKKIFMNLENTYGNPPIVQSNANSHFYLTYLPNEPPVITFISDIAIKAIDSRNDKIIPAGTYKIGSNNKVKNKLSLYTIDLFDKDLHLDKVGDVSTGGTEVTGGVYTDGQ